jgi:hypothetical protein
LARSADRVPSSIGKKRKGLVQELDHLRATIVETLAPEEKQTAADLMWQFLGIADSVFERTDDSGGRVDEVFGHAMEDLGRGSSTMRLQSMIGNTADHRERDVRGPSHAEAMTAPRRVSSTYRAGGRRCRPALRPQWHRIAAQFGGAAGKKPEDLVRQKARPRPHHVTVAMAVLVRKVETQRLQQVKMLARPSHRYIEEPAPRRSARAWRLPYPKEYSRRRG